MDKEELSILKQKQDEKERVQEILNDYTKRKEARRAYEQSWLLNINFLMGNQYSCVLPSGEISEVEPASSYESREVFNHIAPIVESRLAKLGKVRPTVAVRPASGSEKDREVARLTKAVIDAFGAEINLSNLIKKATVWSEVTGTSFYKVVLENEAKTGFEAKQQQENAESGDGVNDGSAPLNATGQKEDNAGLKLKVVVVSPFEIFPADQSEENLDLNPSIIHARAIPRVQAEEMYGVSGLKGESVNSVSLDHFSCASFGSGKSNALKLFEREKEDQVLVIERYTKGVGSRPGKLEIVVGDRLVYDGEMLFSEYPFVRQISFNVLGSFWGGSIIDRCIPVQRAYNAVKNRKIDYLSRLTTGVTVVEEGSVDVDELAEEGLKPGKVVVYRAGSVAPRVMDSPSLPPELSKEEDRLLNELITLTGVSELMRNSMLPSNVTSGTAINLLTEADDNRLSVAAEQIRESVLNLTRLVLGVFKNEVSEERISRLYDNKGKVQLFYWKGSDLKAEDIVLDTENELSSSSSQRRQMVIDLLKMGLFNGENGVISNVDKSKILDMIGFGSYDGAYSLTEEHQTRAKEENLSGEFMVLEVDDHNVHISEHTKRAIELSMAKENPSLVERIIMHIREHKAFMVAEANS